MNGWGLLANSLAHVCIAELLKRYVCIHQPGRVSALACSLITVYLSCWCPFPSNDFRNLNLSPASAAMPNGSNAWHQVHTRPIHFLVVGAAVIPQELGYFHAIIRSSMSCRAIVITMFVTQCRRRQPHSPWPGSPQKGVEAKIICKPS